MEKKGESDTSTTYSIPIPAEHHTLAGNRGHAPYFAKKERVVPDRILTSALLIQLTTVEDDVMPLVELGLDHAEPLFKYLGTIVFASSESCCGSDRYV